MTRIDKIELFHVDIPLPGPFYPSWIPGYPQTENRFTLIRLTTDDGVTGVSAGAAFERERQGLGCLLGPYLIGLDPTDLEMIGQRLKEISFLGWHNHWIEPAFWDIQGKIKGEPVYKLLNPQVETLDSVDVYASSGSLLPVKTRIAYIDEIRSMGFSAVKLRVHSFDPAEDIAIVEAVRRHVGDDFVIAVDANQAWRVALVDDAPLWDLDRASAFARACEPLGVAWLEEPLDLHAYDELAALRATTSTPIAGCELNQGWHECKMFFDRGSYDVYQPDATFCGGLSTSKRVMERCMAEGLGFSPHTWTNGLGFLINLQAFASFPGRKLLEYPFEPPGWVPEARDGLLVEPIIHRKDGTVAVPNRPGLGIEIDTNRLKRYGKRFYRMSPTRLAIQTIRKKGLKTALELKKKKERK